MLPLQLSISVQLASELLPTIPGALRSAQLQRELARAARRARRIGRIRAPRVARSLQVYRAQLFGRPYDVVTILASDRPRVIGIVGLSRMRAAARSSVFERELYQNTDDASVLSEQEASELALELLGAESEQEIEAFLGKVFRKVGSAAKGVTRTVAKAGKSIAKAIDKVNKVIPVKAVLNLSPVGMALRAGKSVGRIAKGENVFKVAGHFVKSGAKDIGQAVQLASTVSSFVPGVGTGVAAALGAAGALAQGQPITQALLTAAKNALPGGAVAAAAFDVASGLVQGKSLSTAALAAARNQLPGGAAARAAFDAGLALARGKKLQDVALTAAGRALPASPFSAGAVAIASKVSRGQNLQQVGAALRGASTRRPPRVSAR